MQWRARALAGMGLAGLAGWLPLLRRAAPPPSLPAETKAPTSQLLNFLARPIPAPLAAHRAGGGPQGSRPRRHRGRLHRQDQGVCAARLPRPRRRQVPWRRLWCALLCAVSRLGLGAGGAWMGALQVACVAALYLRGRESALIPTSLPVPPPRERAQRTAPTAPSGSWSAWCPCLTPPATIPRRPSSTATP